MLRKAIHKLANRATICPHCGILNGTFLNVCFYISLGSVRKGPGLSYIVHDTSKILGKKIGEHVDKFSNAAALNPEVLTLAKKCMVSYFEYILKLKHVVNIY